jgi:signal transduction histidine kinase
MRAFSNLLKNAVQSIPDGREGRINVELSSSPDGYCTIIISDNGVGIADNQRDKIFRPNFTTKSSGMGLGLSMVKNIVEIIGGTIWFTGEYNKGTSFHIRLPLIQ